MNSGLVLPLVLLLPLASGYNYCNNQTHRCIERKMVHFMCRLHKFAPLGSTTRYYDMVPDTPKLQSKILSILNHFRDRFAGGALRTSENRTFERAKRMRLLIWDSELGYMARAHAATISFLHSECRSTKRFPYVGEVMAMMVPKAKPKLSIGYVLERMFEKVFDEHLRVPDPEALLEAFHPVRDFNCAHFLNVISDRTSRVGCGLAVATNCRHGSAANFCHFLTCHFDFNNLNGTYIYKAGEPGSCGDWRTARSNKYPNLCTNNGDLFPMDHGD
ncbi:venom allergen 3-like isoform X1 [Drosophila biarmipes]|uniref:venom allergen 3-like isoform X1 n=1 Tax=Drosophila biarmipes TaxID=125945 RepID=UPI0007E7EA00|nr:venom allergen 3-like isoform X1 [Drosophila biarmipes]